jgi:hypothetical protein
MALRIPVFLIALLTLPILAAEQPVSAPVVQPANWLPLRYSPSIAFGSSTILVVWNEQFSDIYPEANTQLMARLFRKDGTPLRDVQFPLGYGIRPRAVWIGSEYLIGASSRRNGRRDVSERCGIDRVSSAAGQGSSAQAGGYGSRD